MKDYLENYEHSGNLLDFEVPVTDFESLDLN